jgi:UDP-N-acetylmuramoyl-tripeptide--D-alanyl-D-alanine ligase
MKLQEVIQIISGKAGDFPQEALERDITGYSIDSRAIREGELFFAIKGEVHNGHKFVADVLAKGTIAAVVSDIEAGERLIQVADTLTALQHLASAVVNNWRGKLVAVTGSAGKTTTKDLTATTLSQIGRVIKTQGNLNNAYGLPLSILKMETDGAQADDFDFGVFEMGMNHAGEIAALTAFASPDVGIITNVAAVHLEFFDSIDGIADAKAEMVRGIKPGGTAILNADDFRVARMRSLRDDIGYLTFGIEENADVMARNIESDGLSGTEFTLVMPRGEVRVRLPLVGRHNLYNALAASAVAEHHDVPLETIAAAFVQVAAPKMRGEVLRFAAGFTVIDDSYNSNPRALVEMVTTMQASKGYQRKIVVAGEMLELGEAGAQLHREAGEQIAALGVNLLIGVRGLASELISGARHAGMSEQTALFFATPQEAAEYAAQIVRVNDLILVKGSRGVKTEIIVGRLKEGSQKSESSRQYAEIKRRQ